MECTLCEVCLQVECHLETLSFAYIFLYCILSKHLYFIILKFVYRCLSLGVEINRYVIRLDTKKRQYMRWHVHDVHVKPVAKKHIVVRAFTKKWCNLLTFCLQTSLEKLTGCTICGLTSLAWKL